MSNTQNTIPNNYKQLTSIAGSVVVSNNLIQELMTVRKESRITQNHLAKVNDYEESQRLSFGVAFIKKYILILYGLAQKNYNKRAAIIPQTTSISTIPISEFEGKEA